MAEQVEPAGFLDDKFVTLDITSPDTTDMEYLLTELQRAGLINVTEPGRTGYAGQGGWFRIRRDLWNALKRFEAGQ